MDAIAISMILFGIVSTLIGVLYNIHNMKITALEIKTSDHEKRVQKVEDVQGNKIDTLIKDVDEIKIHLHDLAEQVHIKNNDSSQLNITMDQILQYLRANK